MTQAAKVIEWAEKKLIGKKVYHHSLNKEILFTKQGIKHAVRSKINPLKIEVVYYLKELLETSYLLKIEKDKKGRPEIKQVITFYSNWIKDKTVYSVYMIAREGKNGHVYYDHIIIKKINLD